MKRKFYKKVLFVLLILLGSSGCFLFNEKITPEEKKCMTLTHFTSVGQIEYLKDYIINKGYYINCKYRGITPLHIAAARGDLNTVKFLLKGTSKNQVFD
ncbi:MAG: ankyrin repeat domain-containing protein [Desulfobacterales bacterium]|nr:ankyrin repeat domain-containing protein [Desulfobacterales bacterium]